MRREADRAERRELGDGHVDVEIWFEPSQEEWDGCEPLPENAEVYDVLVQVTAAGGWTAGASCGMCSIIPGDDYLNSVAADLVDEAIANLESELNRAAAGFGVEEAKRRRDDARKARAIMFPKRKKAS